MPIPASARESVGSSGSQQKTIFYWQKELKKSIRSSGELIRHLGLEGCLNWDSAPEHCDFPVFVTQSFLNRMEYGDPYDPLLRQVLPVEEEFADSSLTSADPVGDQSARKHPGLLQKYHGRALLILSGQCAIHCRYCFRREYDYQNEPRSLDQWESAFCLIEDDATIKEVILSGGDPLMLSDNRLEKFISRIEMIPHVSRLRIHTRMPIVLPSRVTDSLIRVLQSSRLSVIMVVHANHPNEIARDCNDALSRFVKAGIPTLNQTVLLKGINDHVDALVELSDRLIHLGVLPYYLHQLDRVNGAMHFEVPVATGKLLIEQMQQQLPGYAVPRYVQEIPGETSKVVL